MLAASVVGRSHSSIEQDNEDAVATAIREDGTLLLALADGAGSARRSREGAWLAVETAISSLERGEPPEDWCDELLCALAAVRRSVSKRAREARSRPRDFACTLLLAAITDERLSILQLGDGAVIARIEDQWLRLLKPQRGRYAGETVFVTSRRAASLAETETRTQEGLRAIVLLSDGLEPVATDVASGAPHHPFFEPLLRFASLERSAADQEAELAGFLASDRVQSRSSDDLSLILAIKR